MTGPEDDDVRAVRALVRLARLLECSTELSLSQYRVLAAVADGGERATHLARALALAKPTVTAAVDGLVERGLMLRTPVPGDRRSVRIALTEEGQRVLEEAEVAMIQRLRSVVDEDGVAALAALTVGPAADPSRAAR